MNSKIISIVIGLVLALGIGTLVYSTKKPVVLPLENITPKTSVPNTIPVVSTPASSGITLAQIAQHASRTSCWSAVNGSVYDLTSWIPNHPGGEKNILSLCGIDGSSGYNGQHGGSAKTARILSGFKLGALVQ